MKVVLPGLAVCFHRHLNTHAGIEVITHGGSEAVADSPPVVKRVGDGRTRRYAFLSVDIPFPMLIETVAEHGGDTRIVVTVMRP